MSSSAKADDPVITGGSFALCFSLNCTFAGYWMPAFAGMTLGRLCFALKLALMGKRASSNHRRMITAIERYYCVYILASAIGGTLYIGVTNNLVRQVYEHRMGLADGFTKKYRIHRLVYFEQYSEIEAAILREKRLKKWRRAWKIRLIEELNPTGIQ